MSKTILLTGATDGIGLETAKMLRQKGHHLLLHGRNSTKLQNVMTLLNAMPGQGSIEGYLADLSDMSDIQGMADMIHQKHSRLDVLINNAGVFKVSNPITADGLDIRFVVNTIAPYFLTQQLATLFDQTGRIINLASAAQAPVDLQALLGKTRIHDDFNAYAQSKLALMMWSRHMASSDGPIMISVNPGSLLGTKMVTEAFGPSNKSISIGADILTRLALDEEFATASGQYFDNDSGRFAPPHPDGLDAAKSAAVVDAIDSVLERIA